MDFNVLLTFTYREERTFIEHPYVFKHWTRYLNYGHHLILVTTLGDTKFHFTDEKLRSRDLK